MFSVSESREHAEAEGQEKGAVTQQLPSPGKAQRESAGGRASVENSQE